MLVGWWSGLTRLVANQLRVGRRAASSNLAPTVDEVDVAEIMAQFERKHVQRAKATRPSRSKAARARCPTPRKLAYSSLAAAKGARATKSTKGDRMRAYLCSCGSYHLARREAP